MADNIEVNNEQFKQDGRLELQVYLVILAVKTSHLNTRKLDKHISEQENDPIKHWKCQGQRWHLIL